MSNLSVCGTDCSACYCFEKQCSGCNECKGRVFHVAEGGTCPIYECAVYRSGKNNCGECKAAPCDIWMKTRDPNFTDREFAKNVKMRLQALQMNKGSHGDE